MDKNYYDSLQINQNASPEIIDKAYKTLAKKYHPDLQEENNKKEAEEILKEINEAYEILSDPNKKALYDQNLKNKAISREAYNKIYEENQNLKSKLNNIQNKKPTNINHNTKFDNYNEQKYNNKDFEELQKIQKLEYQKQQLAYQQQLEQARQKAYHDAYIQDLKNRGYRIKYNKSLKDYLRGIISIITIIIVLILLWHIPFIQDFFIKLYRENELLNTIINFFIKFF